MNTALSPPPREISIFTDNGAALPPGLTHIYFVRAPSVGLIKIGQAWNVRSRYRSLRSMSPVPLEMAFYYIGDPAEEKVLHADYCAERRHGEWFAESDRLRELIDMLRRSKRGSTTPHWATAT